MALFIFFVSLFPLFYFEYSTLGMMTRRRMFLKPRKSRRGQQGATLRGNTTMIPTKRRRSSMVVGEEKASGTT